MGKIDEKGKKNWGLDFDGITGFFVGKEMDCWKVSLHVYEVLLGFLDWDAKEHL